MTQTTFQLTPELVKAAQAAMRSRDRDEIAKYWDPGVRFLVPGNHPYAGWREGLDEFMSFHNKLVELSGGSIRMEMFSVLVNEDGYSIDMNRCHATRVGAAPDSTSPYDQMRFEGVDVLKWENGRVVEGYAAIFGEGMTNWNLFLSPVTGDGHHVAV
ncbi:nuclear transport factor 2 family protein [Kutzneria chonburiensis]|uniref:Nuclear transport factor 2 family protein n=1 Tax=Kutzneria chonburiensis TaxID=1483604 RepID=A0ABV6MXI8_9PSEU|nr:nuclear transport factor 2 family protein [Kutzneria chonburiensis]